MLQQRITNLSYAAFEERCIPKKVILLYPHTAYRTVFLSYLLQYAGEGLIYCRLLDQYASLQEWLPVLVEQISDALPELRPALQAALEHTSAMTIGEMWAAAFSGVNLPRVVLYLDELDRVLHDADFRQLMRTLVNELPANVQIAVNGRMLTYESWMGLVEQGKVAVLGTSFRSNNLIFTPEKHPRPQLEINAFGRGHVFVNGYPVESWDGALPRNLFFYFVDNAMISRENIFQTFWNKLPTREATNVFHVTKRKIAERLFERVDHPEKYELTRYISGNYRPSDTVARHYDVAEFEISLQLAANAANDEDRIEYFRRAIDVYRAPFLTSIDMPWVNQRRDQLRLRLVEALISLGRLLKQQHYWEDALGYFTRALREVPQREDLHCEVMNIYWQLGRKQDAITQYRLVERYLDENVGVPPARETRDLFQQIQSSLQ